MTREGASRTLGGDTMTKCDDITDNMSPPPFFLIRFSDDKGRGPKTMLGHPPGSDDKFQKRAFIWASTLFSHYYHQNGRQSFSIAVLL